MHAWLWAVLLLFATGLVPAAATSDGSLDVRIKLESRRVRKSDSWALVCQAEFRNRLKEPLRWHPAPSFYETHFGRGQTQLVFQSTDGRYFVHFDQLGFGPEVEQTAVLVPGEKSRIATTLNHVIETDANWREFHAENGITSRYFGPLPEGEYKLWLRYFDGPSQDDTFPERAPGEGIYISNTLRLTILPDGTPGVAQPHAQLELDGPRVPADPFVQHGETRMVWAQHLAQYGVRVVPDDDDRMVTLVRLNRRVVLPRLESPEMWMQQGASPAPALHAENKLRNERDYLVPLEYVSSKLGIRVTVDGPRKK